LLDLEELLMAGELLSEETEWESVDDTFEACLLMARTAAWPNSSM